MAYVNIGLLAKKAEKEEKKSAPKKQTSDIRARTVNMNRKRALEDENYAPAGVDRSTWDDLRTGKYTTASTNTGRTVSPTPLPIATKEEAEDFRARTVNMNRQRAAADSAYAPAGVDRGEWDKVRTEAEISSLESKKNDIINKNSKIVAQNNRLRRSNGLLPVAATKTMEENQKKINSNRIKAGEIHTQINKKNTELNIMREESERERLRKKYNINLKTFTSVDLAEWREKNDYNFMIIAGKRLSNSDEKDKDYQILERIANDNEVRMQAENAPIASSIGTVVIAPAMGIASSIANIKNTADTIRGKGIDINSNLNRGVSYTPNIRSVVDEKYASKWFGGKETAFTGNVGSFVYNTGMSMADNVANLLFAKAVIGGVGLEGESAQKAISSMTSGLMASNAAANSVIENKKKGLSDEKALMTGLATGAVEYLTELYSLEQIMKTPKTLFKGLLKDFAAEASEEIASNHLNRAADFLINQDDSELSKSIQNYIDNGYSEKEAIKKVLTDCFWEDVQAGLAGGVSGAAMGGAYHGINAINTNDIGHDIKKGKANVSYQAVILAGLDSENAKTRSAASEMAELYREGKTPSDYDIGKLYLDVTEEQKVKNTQPTPLPVAGETYIQAGQATKIYHPYTGKKPNNKYQTFTPIVEITPESYDIAAKNFSAAQNESSTDKSFSTILKGIYNKWFDNRKKESNIIRVDNVEFDGKPYDVALSKTAVGKIVSDKNNSVEKIAVLENIDNIVRIADYVGSGSYIQKGKKNKLTTRFDYFETNAKINGEEYVVTFDVEVFPNTNNYRTHKVINKMELIPLSNADLGPAPSASESNKAPGRQYPGTPSNDIVPQSLPIVKQENIQPVPLTTDKDAPMPQPLPIAGENNKTKEQIKTDAKIMSKKASVVQPKLNAILDQTSKELGLQGYTGNTKSVDSMVNKVVRKVYNEGKSDYNINSMKDHSRGALFMNNYSETTNTINALIGKLNNAEVEVKNNRTSGYFGVHLTSNIDGVNVEVQICTPEIWEIKKTSDVIYDKWRNVDRNSMNAETLKNFQIDYERSKKLWDDYFTSHSIDRNALTSSIEEGVLPSSISPIVIGRASHFPSTNVKTGSSESKFDTSTSLPDSVNTRSDKLSLDKSNIGTTPSNNIIPQPLPIVKKNATVPSRFDCSIVNDG